MKNKIGIIGAGVVGTAVGVVLNSKGFEITGVHDTKFESTRQFIERIECTAHTSPQEVSRSADILFITTTDSSIQEVVNTLVDNDALRPGQVIIHMSGAYSSEILSRAKECCTYILSIHPLQSFASLEQAIENLPGSVFSIEGDKEAYDIAVRIIEILNGAYFLIDKEAKPLYHAGACVVSNYLVTLIDLGVKLLKTTGIPGEIAVKALMPLINGTINNIENVGIPDALTGPIARGDINTITKHQECLIKMAPEFSKLYNLLGFYTAFIAEEKGTINEKTREEFQKMFLDSFSL